MNNEIRKTSEVGLRFKDNFLNGSEIRTEYLINVAVNGLDVTRVREFLKCLEFGGNKKS